MLSEHDKTPIGPSMLSDIGELSKLTADEIDFNIHVEEVPKRFPADDDWNVDKCLWSLTIDLVNKKVHFPVTLALAYALRLLRVKELDHPSNQQPESCQSVVWAYLECSEKYLDNDESVLAPQNKQATKRRRGTTTTNEKTELNALVASVSVLHARLLADDGIAAILSELIEKEEGNSNFGLDTPCTEFSSTLNDHLMASLNHGRPLHYQKECLPPSSHLLDKNLDQDTIELVVAAEVQRAVGIDLHTHLLPPTHGPLCLWGIDELLTYVSTTTLINRADKNLASS